MFSRAGYAAALSAALGMLMLTTTPAAAVQTTLSGIDISHWNGQPKFGAVAADGVRFVIAKATEGRNWQDPEYANNRSRAMAAGLAFTAYHFARPDKTSGDARSEADNFVDTAGLKGRNIIPVIDLEDHGGLGKRRLKRWLRDWLDEVEARLGVKAMIYTSPAFWRDRVGDSRWFADHGYRLWIAHWGADQPRVPAANWGGRGWAMWQYTSRGSVAGISGDVDRDLYAGTRLGPIKIKNNR